MNLIFSQYKKKLFWDDILHYKRNVFFISKPELFDISERKSTKPEVIQVKESGILSQSVSTAILYIVHTNLRNRGNQPSNLSMARVMNFFYQFSSHFSIILRLSLLKGYLHLVKLWFSVRPLGRAQQELHKFWFWFLNA